MERLAPARVDRDPGRRRPRSLLVLLAAAVVGLAGGGPVHGQAPSSRWGRLANPGVEGRALRSTLFFSGQAKDGTNPYGCRVVPPSNVSLYTVTPADARHLAWSSSRANRDFALEAMVEAGINVVSMSSWGEEFLPCDESWALWAPMQTAPRSHDELFAAASGKPIWIVPFIESRANWTFYNEFPRWTDGRVAPGTVSQIVELVERYLKDPEHPEWARSWARLYDSSGQPRYAVAIIHASSNRLGPDEHQAYASGFDLVADEVLDSTGVRVGFLIDALPPTSFAPGSFKPSAALTGPFLLETRSLLGIQCFLPEVWMMGSPDEAARIQWKRQFARGWNGTGIPFVADVSPGYDAHLVFPGSVRYGYTAAWLSALTGIVRAEGCDGVAYNFWNGYTEGVAGMPLRALDGGARYHEWLKELTVLPTRCVEFLRGDPNADGEVDVSDAIAILGHLFLGQPSRLPCPPSADADDSGELDISDAVYLLNFLFSGGPRPDEPFSVCGPDPTPDGLLCVDFAPCR